MRRGPLPARDPRAARPDLRRPPHDRPRTVPRSPDPTVPTVQIDGFDQLELIGKGGFSYVFSARQKDFNRRVALKVLTFGLVDERERRSFERECRAMGLVSQHPHIVTVFNAAFTATKQPVIVMELYSGGTMGDRQKREGRLPVAVVLDTGVKIAGALQTAHDRGLLHRDIKPQNLFISEFGEPALGDFGISTLDDERSISGGGGLTVHYAPPEVLEGAQGHGDLRRVLVRRHALHPARGGPAVRPDPWVATAGRRTGPPDHARAAAADAARRRAARAERTARPDDEQVTGRAPGVGGRVRPGVAADPGRARPAGDGAPARRAAHRAAAAPAPTAAEQGGAEAPVEAARAPAPASTVRTQDAEPAAAVEIRPVGADGDTDADGHTITVGRPVRDRRTRSNHRPGPRSSEASTRRIVIGTAAGVVCLLAVAGVAVLLRPRRWGRWR